MNSTASHSELSALIQLIDEPDENIYSHIKSKIISYGKDAIPYLDHALNHNLHPVAQKRVTVLLHKLQFESIVNELSDWYTLGASNLLLGYLLVSKYHYPNLDEAFVRRELERIKMEIWLELNSDLTALEKVQVINKILFEINGFSGDRKNYYSPLNSYINNVMEARAGNPLALSMLYIILADMVEEPIYGVNLPEHFILGYVDQNSIFPLNDPAKADVLFYINPFSGGAVFTANEIEAFLRQMNVEPHGRYFQPCNNVDMIIRMLTNLINSYTATGDTLKASELEILLKIFQ
ncbi:MAG: transglutaminase-like domain-containing protein [Bacteroidota bacterium]